MQPKPNSSLSRVREPVQERTGSGTSGTGAMQEDPRPKIAPARSTPAAATQPSSMPSANDMQHIGLDLIDESDRLRLHFPPYRKLHELAEDIKRRGQLMPLFVRPRGASYELISGYRRLAALRLNHAEAAHCRIFRDLSDSEAYDIAIMENEDRDDFSVLERAQICLQLQSEGKTAEEIAARFRWTNRRNVYHHYRLAKEASPNLREAMQRDALSLHVALAVIDGKAAAFGDAVEREILNTIVESGMSIREARNHIERVRRAQESGAAGSRTRRDPFLREHKEGAFTIAARIDPKHPDNLGEAIASVEIALKRMRQLKRKLEPATETEPKPMKEAPACSKQQAPRPE
jgi:ParB/RepB/Spo0J family partition protein